MDHGTIPAAIIKAADAQTRHLLARLPHKIRRSMAEHYRDGPRKGAIHLTGKAIGEDRLQWLSILHETADRTTSLISFGDVIIDGMQVTIAADLPDTIVQCIAGRTLRDVVGHDYAAPVAIERAQRISLLCGREGLRLDCIDGRAA